jgi:hypothetical protein
MIAEFMRQATIHTFKGLGNTLFNGFASDFIQEDKANLVGLKCAHFNPISTWSLENYRIVDKNTEESYCNDSTKTVRKKCAALFAASFVAQPIGLTLNLLNRIGKVVTFAHLWNPSKEKYDFKARLGEWVKDILIIIATPLLLVGMLFSALYGATISPYDGRKLFGTFERIAYSGGYQFFHLRGFGEKDPQNYLLAPCFQPEPRAHLGGGDLNQPDVW